MSDKGLPLVTAHLEEQLGPCVLVLRCHDLLGDPPTRTRELAERIVLRELQSLATIIKQAPGSISLAEQFLRTIYSLQMAGRFSEAQSVFQRFVSTFRNLRHGTPIPAGPAFRIGVAMVILNRQVSELLNAFDQGSLAWRLVEAWVSDNPGLLEEVFAEIEDAVIDKENAGRLHPWDDTWHYILLERMEARLEPPNRPGAA